MYVLHGRQVVPSPSGTTGVGFITSDWLGNMDVCRMATYDRLQFAVRSWYCGELHRKVTSGVPPLEAHDSLLEAFGLTKTTQLLNDWFREFTDGRISVYELTGPGKSIEVDGDFKTYIIDDVKDGVIHYTSITVRDGKYLPVKCAVGGVDLFIAGSIFNSFRNLTQGSEIERAYICSSSCQPRKDICVSDIYKVDGIYIECTINRIKRNIIMDFEAVDIEQGVCVDIKDYDSVLDGRRSSV